MRTITKTIYKYSELSDDAKEKARTDAAANWGYSWETEAMDSINALAEHFGGGMKDWSIDWFGGPSNATFRMPEGVTPREIKEGLAKLGSYNKRTGKGNGDCVLTGYCQDESAIDGFRAAWRAGERDLTALMDAAFESWVKDAQSDCEYQYEDEAFAENCEANGYEFDENGGII